MKTLLTAVLAASLVVLSTPAAAGEQIVEPSSEKSFEKNPTIDGKPYLCLGVGIRKKVVFKVYAISFCVEAEAGKAELAKYFEGAGKKHAGKKGKELASALAEDPDFFKALLDMPVDKAAEMIFVRNVGAASMKETFTENLTKSLGAGEKARVDSFVNLLGQDLKEGDKLILRTKTTGDMEVGLGTPQKLNDAKLARAVWDCYFGVANPSPALRESVAAGAAALRN
jgi:hypothetical protein